ncbi:MAG TPA: MarR family transcriptional regulator [Opitutaceae bacterium]
MLKKLPRYECLEALARQYPDLDPSATDAFLHLLRAADELFSAREQSLGAHGISCGRFYVLMQLWDKEHNVPISRTPAELAEVSGVTRATMTGLVDTLERDGFVRRDPAPTDRRMMSVRVTEKGQELLIRILPGHFRMAASLMAPLSEPERKTLVSLLAKILPPHSTSTEPCGGGSPRLDASESSITPASSQP